jgi:hypothetical protein
MKRQKSCGPRLGKLVHQLPGVVTFAYDLRFRRVIARWKGIVEEIHFGGSIMPLAIIEHLDLKKPSFRPSKWPRKLNLLKIVNCQNCQKTILSQSEKVGGHQYPPGSGEDPFHNRIHCIVLSYLNGFDMIKWWFPILFLHIYCGSFVFSL